MLNKKNFRLILTLVIICMFNEIISNASPVSADIIIEKKDNGQIMALSGKNDMIIAQGTDASSIIQKAIDKLPVTGGKIYISTGTYYLTSTIHIEDKHGVHLEGSARGIVFSGGNEGTVLRSERAIDLIEIFGNKLKVAGITINNLHLIGSGKQNGKSGILVLGRSDLLSIHQVGVNHCGIGFYLKGGVVDAPQIQFCDPQVNGIGLKIESSHYAKIIGGEFSDCDEYGILISALADNSHRTMGVKISSVTGVRNGKAGILIGKNTDCITVTGGSDFGGTKEGSGVVITDEGTGNLPRNIIIDGIHSYNNNHAAIYINHAEHVIISNCICSVHNHLQNKGQLYGIHVMPGSENIVINGNITYGNAKQGILDESENAQIKSPGS